MKAIIKSQPAPGADLVDDFPDPTVGPDEILIEVKAASICGSDRSMHNWDASAQGFITEYPRVLGHEAAGVVVETGKAVTAFKPGDHVALDSHAPCGFCYQCHVGNGHNCNEMKLLAGDMHGVFAQFASIPASMAFRLPEEMPFEIGALLEPAGVAWHAVQRADKQIGGNVVVVSGGGPIGLLIIDFALLLGAAEVIAIEPNPYRRGLASQRGACAFSPGLEAQEYINRNHEHRGGADLVFEVSGASNAYPALFNMLRRNGTFIAIGHAAEPVPVSVLHTINKREITLRGIYGRLLWSTWEDLSQLIRLQRVDLSWLITDRLPLSDLGPIIKMLSGESNKIVMFPNGMPD